ncbi:MAG: hypothetical protein E5X65_36710 [Mesorhizobium sp.]|nr:MAG: hypothetical protein E5X65_36710 [Mesorhizobium sp.]
MPRNGVPIEGVIPPKWRSAIIGKDGRINRISYELCVLSQLQTASGPRKSGWSGRTAFAIRTTICPRISRADGRAYYNARNLTSDARAFTRKIQAELERELRLLNAELPRNDKVRILWRGENRISITFQPLPEQQGPTTGQGRDRPALADDGTAGCVQGDGARHRLSGRL